MQRVRSRDVTGPMQDWIVGQALYHHWTPKQIFDYLQNMGKQDSDDAVALLESLQSLERELPEIWTIQRIVRDFTPQDTSDPWKIDDKDTKPDDLACIMAMLEFVIEDSYGEITTLTKDEVEWTLRLHKAAPGAGVGITWRLVRLYMLYRSRGESTRPLDIFVALRPWAGMGEEALYDWFVADGMIPEAPLRSWLRDLAASPIASETMARELTESGLDTDSMSQVTGIPSTILDKKKGKLGKFIEGERTDAWRTVNEVIATKKPKEEGSPKQKKSKK